MFQTLLKLLTVYFVGIPQGWIRIFIKHADILSAAILSLIYAHFLGRRNIFDWFFVIGCSLVCIVLLDQNGGKSGIPTLLAVFIILGELVFRVKTKSDKSTTLIHGVIALQLTLLIFITKPLFHRMIAIQDYYVKSSSAQSCVLTPPKLSTFCVKKEGGFVDDTPSNNGSTTHGLETIRAIVKNDLTSYEYAQTINDGYQLIKSQNIPNPMIFVPDLADPFTFALQLPPRRNGYPFKWRWPNYAEPESTQQRERSKNRCHHHPSRVAILRSRCQEEKRGLMQQSRHEKSSNNLPVVWPQDERST
jgi:hypothetical protein